MVFLIGEIGVNWNGDFEIVRKLMMISKENNLNAVKFQSFSKEIVSEHPLADKLLSNEDKKEKMAKRHPLQRVGTDKDIAQMAAFLLSDRSSWMTGQVLGVDGGMSTLNTQ